MNKRGIRIVYSGGDGVEDDLPLTSFLNLRNKTRKKQRKVELVLPVSLCACVRERVGKRGTLHTGVEQELSCIV